MGVVSSMFINVVIKVCWTCRLYLEQFDRTTAHLTATPGFLHTPEATSTPLSPAPADTTTTPDEDTSRALMPSGRSRNQKSCYGNNRRVKRHSVSEILSPIEEELIRVVMAKGCRLRIGITPSLPKRGSTRRVARGVVLSPSQTCLPLVRAGYHEDFRTRGLRL